MAEEGVPVVVWVALLAVFLFSLSLFFPNNTITGAVILDDVESCGSLGCVELCDADSICGDGLTCCPTHWDTGVCDYQMNCETILDYSGRQSLESYQDSIRERPDVIVPEYRGFWIPLVIIFVLLFAFSLWRKNPLWK